VGLSVGGGRGLGKRKSRKDETVGVEMMLKQRAQGQGRVCHQEMGSHYRAEDPPRKHPSASLKYPRLARIPVGFEVWHL